MQWVLIWMLSSGSGLTTSSQVFYSKETCEIAKGLVEDQFSYGVLRDAKAICTPRTVDPNGAITLDKRP